MSALDRVLALSRGEAEASDDLVGLTWSPAARAASAVARKDHKGLSGHSIGGDRHLYTLPSGHQIHVRSSDGRVMGGEYKRNAEGKDALDAHPDMFEKKFVGKSAAHDDHNIFKPHLELGASKDKKPSVPPVKADWANRSATGPRRRRTSGPW